MNPTLFVLTLEQDLEIRRFKDGIGELSRSELEAAFLELCRQMFVKDNVLRDMIKRHL